MGIFRDKVIVNRHYHDTNVTHVEKRAATDESVRLLKEFEEKAESKFIDRIDVKNNMFEYTLLEYDQSFESAGLKFFYFTKINGKEFKGNVTVDRFSDNPKMDLLKKVHEEIVSRIVREIVVESISTLDENYSYTFRK